jgi:hypothetical protein
MSKAGITGRSRILLTTLDLAFDAKALPTHAGAQGRQV